MVDIDHYIRNIEKKLCEPRIRVKQTADRLIINQS
jgi:hypothetical protein